MPAPFQEDFWAFITPPGYPNFADAARALYASLGSLVKVGKKLGVSKTPLIRVFGELGIPLNPHGGYRWGKRQKTARPGI